VLTPVVIRCVLAAPERCGTHSEGRSTPPSHCPGDRPDWFPSRSGLGRAFATGDFMHAVVNDDRRLTSRRTARMQARRSDRLETGGVTRCGDKVGDEPTDRNNFGSSIGSSSGSSDHARRQLRPASSSRLLASARAREQGGVTRVRPEESRRPLSVHARLSACAMRARARPGERLLPERQRSSAGFGWSDSSILARSG
jgi:hypothetical protein